MATQSLNVDHLIEEARTIETEKQAILKRSLANREILRLLADNGVLDDEQTAEVDRIYPKKVRGVRFYGKSGKKLDRPVYSAAAGEELEGQPLSDEDMAALGLEVPENGEPEVEEAVEETETETEDES